MLTRGGCRSIILAVIAFSIFIFALIFAAKSAYSFGLGTPYLENDTLKLEPGQSYIYVLTIQNNDDLEFDVDFNYSSDEDIARLISLDRHILPKTYNNKALFEIKIPDDAKIGTRYSLAYSAKPVVNETGMVSMTVEIRRSIKIEVVDENGQGYKNTAFDNAIAWFKETYESNKQIFQYLLLAIILILVYFIGKRLWRISKNFSKGLMKVDSVAPMAISEAKTIADIHMLLERIPDEQFETPEIRELFSKKLSELDEDYLSKKILKVDKKHIIGMIKE